MNIPFWYIWTAKFINPKDLEGKSIGLVTGSSAEFAFVGYAMAQGIDLAKVSLKPMPIPDQATFPAGIDAVVPWAPTPALMTKYRKNAKVFADTGPYQLYWGDAHVRTGADRELPRCRSGPHRHGCRGASMGTYSS